jgi:hypothetical protein
LLAPGLLGAEDRPAWISAPVRDQGWIILRSPRALAEGLRCRWVQTDGPPVDLEGSDSPIAQFQAADNAPREFVLVAAGDDQIATASVVVSDPSEVHAPSTPPQPTAPRDVDLPVAHAGDDQVALPGHRVTLNGMASRPRSNLVYRWFQAAGPPIRDPVADGYIYSFVPTAPGTYRFGLIVACDGQISEPDMVDLVVPSPAAAPTPLATVPTPMAAPPPQPSPTPPSVGLLAEECRQALLALPDGPARAESLATAFEGVTARLDLYATYGDLHREIAHRLENLVPADPARRAEWLQRLFEPLSARLLERLRAVGLDLATPAGLQTPLTAPQRDALVEVYRAAAWGFRQASSGSIPAPAAATASQPVAEGLR